MRGRIHSIESFGTVDGPGIRFVIFFQGCPMRCQYCHNPDTWDPGLGTEYSADELIAEFERNRSYYRTGGITATGGEPMLQLDFLLELFEKAKQKNIHTCIDTSGITFQETNASYMEKLDRLMICTDLILLDIKHIDPDGHKKLTGHSNDRILSFARYLDRIGKPVWIRHVVVPGITDHDEYLSALGRLIGSLGNVKALDVLPYHTMGAVKYQNLGIPYPLEGVEALPKEEALRAKKVILRSIKETRQGG